MAKIPMVEVIPRPNRITMIQKEGSLKKILKEPEAGVSPGNSPPLPNRAKARLRITDVPPSEAKSMRQENHRRKTSDNKGAAIKAKLGASSCIAIALPQCLEPTIEVIAAIAEGR
jgi:hypothetical protein